jgi:flagellar biosynthetic protein FliS
MNSAASANAYKSQQILTASREELTLMLYNGAIRFIAESVAATEKADFARANDRNQRAQDIVSEFMATLDMKYEISKNLWALYDYINYRLVQANLHKDVGQLEEAKGLLAELRDTWAEAMKKNRIAKVVGE